MATDRDDPLHHLTSKQALAAVRLVAGDSHDRAADAAGVHRVTVTRWANHHPAFVAEVNRLRADQIKQTAAMIRAVTEGALDVIGSAIAGGDVGVAVQWCRMALPLAVTTVPDQPTESVDVVDQRRRTLPTVVDDLLTDTACRSTAETEALLKARLE